jgi:hypothetical protein
MSKKKKSIRISSIYTQKLEIHIKGKHYANYSNSFINFPNDHLYSTGHFLKAFGAGLDPLVSSIEPPNFSQMPQASNSGQFRQLCVVERVHKIANVGLDRPVGFRKKRVNNN